MKTQLSSYSDSAKASLKSDDPKVVMETCHTAEAKQHLSQPDILNASREFDVLFSALEDITEKCRTYGQIRYIVVNCPNEAKVGEKSTTSVQISSDLCDEVMECELVSIVTGVGVEAVVEKKGESDYEVSYQPAVKGRHQLHITIPGPLVMENPLNIIAKSPIEALETPILIREGLQLPNGVAINQRGEVVVAETGGHCVWVLHFQGGQLQKKFSFGKKGSSDGKFKDPRGVAVDGEGNILVADIHNNNVQKFTPEGEFISSVGSKGEKGPLQLKKNSAIAFNAANQKIYLSNNGCEIQILNSDLTVYKSFGRNGENEIGSPSGVACDSKGHVYVANTAKHHIQVYTAQGEFKRAFGELSHGPIGVAVDCDDFVYVSEHDTSLISVFTSAGERIRSFGKKGKKPGEFVHPFFLAVDGGIVYVCDQNRIQLF